MLNISIAKLGWIKSRQQKLREQEGEAARETSTAKAITFVVALPA
jgi:hypothetical protein